jgi:hypothetical protein
MPRRSNAFQTLVHLIQGQLAPEGASVTESKILPDRRDSKGREVDVVIEGVVAGHEVMISIEATKGGRRATLEWVERMCAKHEHLRTNKLVLVSGGGFTKAGEREARLRGADALTLRQASERDWRIPMKLKSIEFEHRRIYPSEFSIQISAVGSRPLTQGRLREYFLHFEGDIRKVPLVDAIQSVLAGEELGAKMLADTKGPDNWSSRVRLTFRDGTLLAGPGGTSATIHALSFTARYARSNSSIALKYSRFRDHRLAHGSAKTGVGEVVVLITEPSEDAATINFAIVPGTDTGGVGLKVTKPPRAARLTGLQPTARVSSSERSKERARRG